MKASGYADFLILIVALSGIAFGVGEYIGRTQRLAFYCEPGYVKAARYQDGTLACWYPVYDWRRPTVKRFARRAGT